MSLSRTAKLICGTKADFLFVADSGPGQTDAKGLIVPKFGNKPENHVSISMSFESFSEMMLLTKEHFRAWLSAWYSLKMQSAGNQKSFYTSEEQTPENDFVADYGSQPMF